MDVNHPLSFSCDIAPTDYSRQVTLLHHAHGRHAVRVSVQRRGSGWRGQLAYWLRSLAAKLDGRDAYMIHVDSSRAFEPRELSKAFQYAIKSYGDNLGEAMALEITETDVRSFIHHDPHCLHQAYTPPPR